MRPFRLLSLSLVILLAACAGRGAKSDAEGAGAGTGNRISATGVPGRGGSTGIGQATIYFDYDSAQLRDDQKALLDEWGQYLAGHGDTRVILQGHTDERGTPDYNVGLGERRAASVRDALTARGARADQFSLTSLGEEHPADTGHTERAWRKNRRVEILD